LNLFRKRKKSLNRSLPPNVGLLFNFKILVSFKSSRSTLQVCKNITKMSPTGPVQLKMATCKPTTTCVHRLFSTIILQVIAKDYYKTVIYQTRRPLYLTFCERKHTLPPFARAHRQSFNNLLSPCRYSQRFACATAFISRQLLRANPTV